MTTFGPAQSRGPCFIGGVIEPYLEIRVIIETDPYSQLP